MATARQHQELDLLTQDQALERLTLPNGLRADTLNVGRRPRIQKDGDEYVLRLNPRSEIPIRTTEARDDLLHVVGIPKALATSTPEKLLVPVVEHQLGGMDRLVVVSDEENGLRTVRQGKDLMPTLEPARTLEAIQEQFPEVLYQQAAVDPQTFQADVLAITHDQVQRLEEYLQPGQHSSLPRGGDPFRAGVHVRFSPLGTTDPLIQPYMVRLVCTNGAVHQEYMARWGRGYGEGDELYQWFREGLEHAAGSLNPIMNRYAGMVGEELPQDGEQRMLAVEGMIRAARLPRTMSTAVRDMAIANPPRTLYDVWNMLTRVATHHTSNFGEQLRRMTTAGTLVEPEQHHRFCPTCGRN